jgi:hypothetical protein
MATFSEQPAKSDVVAFLLREPQHRSLKCCILTNLIDIKAYRRPIFPFTAFVRFTRHECKTMEPIRFARHLESVLRDSTDQSRSKEIGYESWVYRRR